MKIGGLILWNALFICETFKISCLMRRLHSKDVLEKRFKRPIIAFGYLVEYYRISQESTHLERKSYLDCSSDTLCTLRVEFGRVTYWLQTLELKTMDASEIYSKRLNAKEVIFPKQGEFFPIADERIKTPGGDQDLRTSTLVRHRPIQGESNIDFLGESKGSLPQPHDSLPNAGEAINDFLVHVRKLHIPPSR